jgi:uncharacterized protein
MIEKRFRPKQRIGEEQQRGLITELKTCFSKRVDVAFAYIYGSFSEGNSFRDIDIAVYLLEFNEESVPESDLSFTLSKSTGYPIEVMILNRAPVSFQLSVLKKGVLLVSKSEDLRTDFIDDVGRRYRDYSHFRNLALEA